MWEYIQIYRRHIITIECKIICALIYIDLIYVTHQDLYGLGQRGRFRFMAPLHLIRVHHSKRFLFQKQNGVEQNLAVMLALCVSSL